MNNDVVTWWIKSGYKFIINDIDSIIQPIFQEKNGDYANRLNSIINFMKKYNFEVKLDKNFFLWASTTEEEMMLTKLKILKQNNIPIEINKKSVEDITKSGFHQILQWFVSNEYKFEYDNDKILSAVFLSNNVNTMKWWLDNGMKIDFSPEFFTNVVKTCKKDMVKAYINLIAVDGKVDVNYLV